MKKYDKFINNKVKLLYNVTQNTFIKIGKKLKILLKSNRNSIGNNIKNIKLFNIICHS